MKFANKALFLRTMNKWESGTCPYSHIRLVMRAVVTVIG